MHTSLTSLQNVPLPVNPGGQGPHLKYGLAFWVTHCTPGKQGLGEHDSNGEQETPSPVWPGGHAPHRYPSGKSKHCTPVNRKFVLIGI